MATQIIPAPPAITSPSDDGSTSKDSLGIEVAKGFLIGIGVALTMGIIFWGWLYARRAWQRKKVQFNDLGVEQRQMANTCTASDTIAS